MPGKLLLHAEIFILFYDIIIIITCLCLYIQSFDIIHS